LGGRSDSQNKHEIESHDELLEGTNRLSALYFRRFVWVIVVNGEGKLKSAALVHA